MEKESDISLSALFDKYLDTYLAIEQSALPTNSDAIQTQVEKSISDLEELTRMVSQFGVFSANESLEELPNPSIKLLLIPVLLGSLTLKSTKLERLENLHLASVYFVDFIKRCKEYGLTDVEVSCDTAQNDDGEDSFGCPASRGLPASQNFEALAKVRDQKIKQFKEKKLLEEKLSKLKLKLDNSSHAEDTVRNYYITMVKKYVNDSQDEIDSIQMECSMLQQMEKMKTQGNIHNAKEIPKSKPLRPILITRDEIQKKVFGAGYPSLPTMTVEELYEQRVHEGSFQIKSQQSDGQLLSKSRERCISSDDAKDQEEDIKKETLEENSDEEYLQKMRDRDEWRDTHRTGWGNTYNRS